VRGRRRDAPAPDPLSTGQIRTLALTLLSRREYTAHEVHDRLVRRGADPDAARDVIAALVADKTIDDRRAAGAHARTAARIKGRGRLRIARELSARGIAKEVIHDAVGEVTPEAEALAIRRILTVKRMPAKPDLATRRKLFQHLLRRGFSADAIGKVMRRPDLDEE
jgi:regulatory protein